MNTRRIAVLSLLATPILSCASMADDTAADDFLSATTDAVEQSGLDVGPEGDAVVMTASQSMRFEESELFQHLTSLEDGPVAELGVEPFESRWNAGVESYRLVHCERSRVSSDDGAVPVDDALDGGELWLMQDAADTYVIAGENTGQLVYETFANGALDADTGLVTYANRSGGILLTCEEGATEQMRIENPDFWGAYVYAQTIGQSDGPLYVQVGTEWSPDWEAAERWEDRELEWDAETVQAFLDAEITSGSYAYENAIAWASAAGEVELEFELRRRYRPIGRCSQDTRPMEVADAFGDFCLANGQLGCATTLLVRDMGWRYDRVSDLWIDGQPSQYQSPIEEMAELVDVTRFVPGLLVRDTSPDALVLTSPFLALGVAGSEWSESIGAQLEAWMVDDRIDTLHRTMLASAWVSLQVEEGVPADVAIADAIERDGASPMLPYIFGD